MATYYIDNLEKLSIIDRNQTSFIRSSVWLQDQAIMAKLWQHNDSKMWHKAIHSTFLGKQPPLPILLSHTYIIVHNNPSVSITTQLLTAFMLCGLIFLLQLKVNSEHHVFEKLLMAILFFTLGIFARNLLRGSPRRYCYVFSFIKTSKYEFVNCKQSKNKYEFLVSIKLYLLSALSYVPLFKLIPLIQQ